MKTRIINKAIKLFLLVILSIIICLIGSYILNEAEKNSHIIDCKTTSDDQMFLKDSNHVVFFRKGSGIYEINIPNRSCKLVQPLNSNFTKAYKVNESTLVINSLNKHIIYDLKNNKVLLNIKQGDVLKDTDSNYLVADKMVFLTPRKIQILNLISYKVKTIINLSDKEEFKLDIECGKFKNGKLFLVAEKYHQTSNKNENGNYDFYLLDPVSEKVKKVYKNYKKNFSYVALNKSQKIFFNEDQNDKVVFKLLDTNNGSFNTIFAPLPPPTNYFSVLSDFNNNPLNLLDDTILLFFENYLYLYNPVKNKLLLTIKLEPKADYYFQAPLPIPLKDGNILLFNDYNANLKGYLFSPKYKKVINVIKPFPIKYHSVYLNTIDLNNGDILFNWTESAMGTGDASTLVIKYDLKNKKFYETRSLILNRYKPNYIILNDNQILFYAGKPIALDDSYSDWEEMPERPEIYTIDEVK